MDAANVSQLVEHLGSDEDAVRKMAAFKLQSSIADPSFADAFMNAGGMTKLRWLSLQSTGNTLAYSLNAFSRLLDVEMGWDFVDQILVTRVVELVVTHPLVNILRGAMSILAAVVSHPYTSATNTSEANLFGFDALRPAIAAYPQFLEMLVNRLSSADHALCTNALQLINALMRDAVTTGSEQEWPKFIKKLQDLGVIRAVYSLMHGSALQDLAQPLFEFQGLTKVLLRKWREMRFNTERSEHKRVAKNVYLATHMDIGPDGRQEQGDLQDDFSPDWAKLGFRNENLEEEFEDVGFLGMMDLADYVRKNEDNFQRILLEQATQSKDRRCPIARASIAVTSILYEHFDIDKYDLEDARGYMAIDSRNNLDKIFKPLLLQWSKLHTSGLQSFLRLWKATGAEILDFAKVAELVRILLEAVIGGASRTRPVHAIEEEIQGFEYQKLRELQMELFELGYEDSWGHYLRQVRDELHQESLQFIKEQRIRCLLSGAWFPDLRVTSFIDGGIVERDHPWGYVKLSHNRRYLHYVGCESKFSDSPTLDELREKVDLSIVSSVVSNVTAVANSPTSSTSALPRPSSTSQSQTRISINRLDPNIRSTANNSQSHRKTPSSSSQRKEMPLLTLRPSAQSLAAEWLDGLLMLLNQAPITPETRKLLAAVSGWGLKLRLLNVKFDNTDDFIDGRGITPDRDGLDEDYYYDLFGGP